MQHRKWLRQKENGYSEHVPQITRRVACVACSKYIWRTSKREH